MDLPLTPEFESKLNKIASQTGRAAAQVVQELIANTLSTTSGSGPK